MSENDQPDGSESNRSIERYRSRDAHGVVSYGPVPESSAWVLAVTTTEGRVEIVLPDDPMYELWTEVRGVPWPWPEHEEKRDRLVRQLVHAANDADEGMLREALEALGVGGETA